MSNQNYRVIADRAVIGDKVDFETWDVGDLLVYRYPGRGNHPGELVRIERPVPSDQEPDDTHRVADEYWEGGE